MLLSNAPPQDLVSLHGSGRLSVVRISPGAKAKVTLLPVQGWLGRGQAVCLLPTSRKHVLVALINRSSGSEVVTLSLIAGTAKVLERSQTHEWFSGLGHLSGRDAFFAPQNSSRVGTFHLANSGEIVWDSIPTKRRSLPDRTLFSQTRNLWLNITTLSESVSFAGYECVRGKAVPVSDERNPIQGITAIGLWRSGKRFGVLDTGGQIYAFDGGASNAPLVSGSRALGRSYAFAEFPNRPCGLVIQTSRVLLVQRSGQMDWSPVSSYPIKGEKQESGALVSPDGRSVVVVMDNGTAHVLMVSAQGKLSSSISVHNFADSPSSQLSYCFLSP